MHIKNSGFCLKKYMLSILFVKALQPHELPKPDSPKTLKTSGLKA